MTKSKVFFLMLTKNCRRIPCWLISRRLAISDGIQSRFPIDKPVPYDLVKGIIGIMQRKIWKKMKGEECNDKKQSVFRCCWISRRLYCP